MKLSNQLMILILVVVMGLVSVGAYGLFSLRNSLIDSSKHELETVLTFAKKQAQFYMDKEQKGEITRAEAEQAVVEVLSQYRDGAAYIWSNDNNAVARVHIKPEKIGQKQDSYAGHIAALAREEFIFDMAENAKPGTNEMVLKVNAVTKLSGWNWVLGLGVYMDDLSHAYWNFALRFLLIGLVVVVVIIGIVTFISRSIFKKLGGEPNYAVMITNKIAQGHLDEKIEGNYVEDSLLGSIHKMQNSLKNMVENIQQAAVKLNDATKQLSSQFSSITSSSQSSSDASISTSAAIQELSHCINDISSNAKLTEDNSSKACDISLNGVSLMEKSNTTTFQIADKIGASVSDFKILQDKSNEIGNIVKVISDIAEQTNLLALNAAIEAARAGEQGRGFAVVADEVRTLASRTAKATQEITSTIEIVQRDTDKVADTLTSILPVVEQNVDVAKSVSSVLNEINSSTTNTLEMSQQVSNATHEQKIASDELASHVDLIAEMVKHTADSVSTCNVTVVGLQTLAKELNASVNSFTLNKR